MYVNYLNDFNSLVNFHTFSYLLSVFPIEYIKLFWLLMEVILLSFS